MSDWASFYGRILRGQTKSNMRIDMYKERERVKEYKGMATAHDFEFLTHQRTLYMYTDL